MSRALPLPVTSFVGRDEDRLAVADLLGEVRLLTLHGPGGVGKTRLALEVTARIGHRYRDGICFCDLAAIRACPVARAIATAAGLSERAFRRLDDQLIDNLAGRQLLLVLDNCEHVADDVAVIAERLLRETRSVAVLATSRERLGVDGEHVWPVKPLAAERSRRTRGAPVPGPGPCGGSGRPARHRDRGDYDSVRQAGRPAAGDRAGRRPAPRHHCRELAENLDDRFRLLTAGHRAHRRHHSLRAVVDWSYQQLTPAEQQLFSQLSVFQGWFDIGAARAVAAPAAAGADDVTHLVLHLATGH